MTAPHTPTTGRREDDMVTLAEMACYDPEDLPEPCEPTPEDDDAARREFARIIDRETRVVEALVTERLSPHSRVRA